MKDKRKEIISGHERKIIWNMDLALKGIVFGIDLYSVCELFNRQTRWPCLSNPLLCLGFMDTELALANQ